MNGTDTTLAAGSCSVALVAAAQDELQKNDDGGPTTTR